MRKSFYLTALLGCLLPGLATATCTWSQTGVQSAKVVCTTANETIPTGASDGLWLGFCKKGISVFVAADSGKVLTGSGTVKVAVYSDGAAAWGEVPDLAMSPTVASARYQGFAGLFVADSQGRIAVYPVSVGVDAGGFTAYLTCS